MTDAVCSALGIDRVDMRGKLGLIEEQHGSDANFLVNSVLSRALENGQDVCLVLFHNTFGHYHNIGMKLGYNLNVLRERGQVTVVEPMKMIASDIEELGHDSIDAANVIFRRSVKPAEPSTRSSLTLDTGMLRRLVLPLWRKCLEVADTTKSVVMIVDDLSHLFDLGLSLQDVWYYVKYLNSLMNHAPTLSLWIMTHTYKADPETCQPDMIAVGLKHMAHLVITVQCLSTGRPNDSVGRMCVWWKVFAIRGKYNWAEKTTYLYKLSDRQIKVFAPGATVALS